MQTIVEKEGSSIILGLHYKCKYQAGQHCDVNIQVGFKFSGVGSLGQGGQLTSLNSETEAQVKASERISNFYITAKETRPNIT